jgi:hypothetical protein
MTYQEFGSFPPNPMFFEEKVRAPTFPLGIVEPCVIL